MIDGLIATTARDITFRHNGSTKRVLAGTTVYATVRSNGIEIRLPGTLYTQTVYAAALDIP